ncbi:hypothetical protein FA13DRAFT_1719952 [Coprinellus micaceus]|uniref:Uncharacterized protein n=1 Tax=Coprinellus micaceus TaxID=71717 RepID=A0A4Y7SAA4_COPMI|nr:hypothetical protein FA13DRAFT_1719952 [Coprinellus micaceus]
MVFIVTRREIQETLHATRNPLQNVTGWPPRPSPRPSKTHPTIPPPTSGHRLQHHTLFPQQFVGARRLATTMMRKTYVPPFVLLSGLKIGGGCPEEGEEVIDGGGREKRIDASPLTGDFPIRRFAIKLDRGSSNRARAVRGELPDLDVGTSSRRARIDLPRNRSSTT